MFAYCGSNPVNHEDPSGDLWFVSVIVGVASQYVSDVVGNLVSGKTGLDIFKPTSSVGEYVAAGVTALIPGSGFGAAVVRNTVSECILWAENKLTGKGEENNLVQSAANILVGSAIDTGVEWISDKISDKIRSLDSPNYSTYAGKAYKKNPNLTRQEVTRKMRRSSSVNYASAKVVTAAIGFARGFLPM